MGIHIKQYPTTGGAYIWSYPSSGNYRVTHLEVDAITGELAVEYDNIPDGNGLIPSGASAGNYTVTNLQVDTNGKLVVEYEDTPIE